MKKPRCKNSGERVRRRAPPGRRARSASRPEDERAVAPLVAEVVQGLQAVAVVRQLELLSIPRPAREDPVRLPSQSGVSRPSVQDAAPETTCGRLRFDQDERLAGRSAAGVGLAGGSSGVLTKSSGIGSARAAQRCRSAARRIPSRLGPRRRFSATPGGSGALANAAEEREGYTTGARASAESSRTPAPRIVDSLDTLSATTPLTVKRRNESISRRIAAAHSRRGSGRRPASVT
jgi:hypothetical protein